MLRSSMQAHVAVSGSSLEHKGRGGSERMVKVFLVCGCLNLAIGGLYLVRRGWYLILFGMKLYFNVLRRPFSVVPLFSVINGIFCTTFCMSFPACILAFFLLEYLDLEGKYPRPILCKMTQPPWNSCIIAPVRPGSASCSH